MKRPSSRVKLDIFKATFLPMSSDSLSLSGLVRTQMVRLLKSEACCMTRLMALSPVGSPTSDTITMMLLVFFFMYSSTSSWVTRFIRRSSLAKWAPGRSTNVRVVSLGPGEERYKALCNIIKTIVFLSGCLPKILISQIGHK